MIQLNDQPPMTIAMALFAGIGTLALLLVLLPALVIVHGPPAANQAPLLLPALKTEGRAFADYAMIAERPLFNPERRKDPPPPPEAPAKPLLPLLTDYRLVGIVIAKSSRLALIERKSAKQIVTVHPGDDLDGRRVDDIREQGVTLSGGQTPELLSIPRADGTGAAQIHPKSP